MVNRDFVRIFTCSFARIFGSGSLQPKRVGVLERVVSDVGVEIELFWSAIMCFVFVATDTVNLGNGGIANWVRLQEPAKLR